MVDYVSRIEASQVHGRLNIELDLFPHINVLYGRNGSGKTTLLHILANILNGSFDRFAFLKFKEIRLFTNGGKSLEVRRSPDKSVLCVVIDGQTETFSINEILEREERREREDMPEGLRDEIGTLPLSDKFPVHDAVYFPAFRTMIEAWSDELLRPRFSPPELHYRIDFRRFNRTKRITWLARRVFGGFVPELRYPSPTEIEEELNSKIMSAAYRVFNEGQTSLSEAFLDAFAAITGKGQPSDKGPNELLVDIRKLLEELDRTRIVRLPDGRQEDVYDRLREMIPAQETGLSSDTAASVLSVYRRSLEQRIQVQRKEFAPFERYLDAVNGFLEGKRLVLRSDEAGGHHVPVRVLIEFDDGSTSSLRSLSSGERQIVSMLYAATYLSGKDSVVLIDEPEISLHIDWQRLLLKRMAQQLGDRQIIVCTHAPEIAGDYEEEFQEIRPIVAGGPISEDGVTVPEDEGEEMLL